MSPDLFDDHMSTHPRHTFTYSGPYLATKCVMARPLNSSSELRQSYQQLQPSASKMASVSESRKLAAASPKSKVPKGAIPRSVNFLLGGAAGWAGTWQRLHALPANEYLCLHRVGAVFFTQPLDLIKNRMQMSGKLGNLPKGYFYIILLISSRWGRQGSGPQDLHPCYNEDP